MNTWISNSHHSISGRSYVHPLLVRKYASVSRYAAMAVLSLSILITGGWIANIGLLTHPFGPTIASSNSIMLMICSAALLMLLSQSLKLQRAGRALSVVAAVCAVLALVEDLCGSDLGLNHIWYQTSTDSPSITFPGPLAPDVALMFILVALAVTAFEWCTKGNKYPYQYPLVLAAATAAMPLLGQACGATYLCTLAGCIKMPPLISVAFLVLSLAALFAIPGKGLTETFAKDSVGGKLTRRFSVAVLILPVLLWIKNMGVEAGLYEPAFGWVIFCMLAVGLIFGCVTWNASFLDTEEQAKDEALLRLQEALTAPDRAAVERISLSRPRLKNVCLTCSQEFAPDLSVCPHDGDELTKLADDPMVGTVLSDRYEIISLLGAGGMSRVYKAKHCSLPKLFAIKIIHSYLATDLTNLKRFQQEARSIGKLSHPNLVSVQDFGVTADGQAYMAMDYLDGCNLNALTREAPLDVNEAIPLFTQICDGLAHAHEQGIVHRDLKSSNIMIVDANGERQIKIVDFGLAKTLLAIESRKLTQTGEIFGTPQYMSPEQCSGLPVDNRSDIYALGCIMYECLSGRPPFCDQSVLSIVRMQISEQPDPFAKELGVPEWLEAEVFKAMDKSKDKRHQSALELKAALLAGSQAIVQPAAST